MFTVRQQREVFHFFFLKQLLRISDPKLYALKGGVNLRFFFKSPRYSEDMDLDAFGGSVETLKKNGYKVIDDPGLRRALQTYGIDEVRVNDREKAKHTDTTQRFRLQLVTSGGVELPTKVEFSRRRTESDSIQTGTLDPEIAKRYSQLAFRVPHYSGDQAAIQKVRALPGRDTPQARDLFDLYLLYLGGFITKKQVLLGDKEGRDNAVEVALSINFNDYQGQVVEFLEDDARIEFGSRDAFDDIQTTVVELLGDE